MIGSPGQSLGQRSQTPWKPLHRPPAFLQGAFTISSQTNIALCAEPLRATKPANMACSSSSKIIQANRGPAAVRRAQHRTNRCLVQASATGKRPGTTAYSEQHTQRVVSECTPRSSAHLQGRALHTYCTAPLKPLTPFYVLLIPHPLVPTTHDTHTTAPARSGASYKDLASITCDLSSFPNVSSWASTHHAAAVALSCLSAAVGTCFAGGRCTSYC